MDSAGRDVVATMDSRAPGSARLPQQPRTGLMRGSLDAASGYHENSARRSGVSITHFYDLSVYGEQIMLSVRYGNWTIINDPDTARHWARYWRPEIQGYVRASRGVNGIDLIA